MLRIESLTIIFPSPPSAVAFRLSLWICLSLCVFVFLFCFVLFCFAFLACTPASVSFVCFPCTGRVYPRLVMLAFHLVYLFILPRIACRGERRAPDYLFLILLFSCNSSEASF